MNTDLEELERLLAKANKEQAEIDHYSGGSSMNYSQRSLGAWVMLNGKSLIAKAREADELRDEVERLKAERDTPHVSDFLEAVKLEAAHQRERWGSDHDAGKTPFDWFWLIGYLAQKAADAATRGDTFKALHHTISTAAALANWHSAIAQVDNTMRPGIVPDDEAQARAALGEAK